MTAKKTTQSPPSPGNQNPGSDRSTPPLPGKQKTASDRKPAPGSPPPRGKQKIDSLNRGDLIKILNQKHGLPKAFADDILQTILDTITTQLQNNGRVMLRNFGTFEMRWSDGKPRPKFNPAPRAFTRSKKSKKNLR